jgi:methyl-accepting chemotaxis protein
MLKNLKMRTKLIGGFMLVALIAGLVGITGIVNIRRIAKADLFLYEDQTAPLPVLSHIAVAFQRSQVVLASVLSARTAEQSLKFENQIADIAADIDKTTAGYDVSTMAPEEKKMWDDFVEARKTYSEYRQRIIATKKAGKPEQGWTSFGVTTLRRSTSGLGAASIK